MDLSHFPGIGSLLHHVSGDDHRGEPSSGARSNASNTLGALLALEDILLDVVSGSKADLIDEIGQHVESVHGLGRGSVAPALNHRERISSTALGHGVAIPHARVAGLEHIQLMYVRLKFPLLFEAKDGAPVTDVLVLLVPKEAAQEHLDLLAQASKLLSDGRFRDRLHQCKEPLEVKQLFQSWPAVPA